MRYKRARLFICLLLIPLTLLAACSNGGPSAVSVPPSAAAAVSAAPSPSPDLTYSVKTDYSKLTPYQPPEEIYTRLSEDYMPALVPSDDYGLLVPYVGERYYGTYMGDAGVYGLMTAAGTMVTDAVYVSVWQPAVLQKDGSRADMPVYHLTTAAENADIRAPWAGIRRAVCALDGSWVTPFDYESVMFCDAVMLLVRNREKIDVDVMDYSGRLLYRFSALDCFGQLAHAPSFETIDYGGGYMMTRLKNDTVVYIEERTGETVYTDYREATVFRDGLACVQAGGMYGYIDTDFRFAIPPAFEYASSFQNGKAVVHLTDGTQAVIDTRGSMLFKSDAPIASWFSMLFQTNTNGVKRYYDSAFQPVALKPGVTDVYYLSDGWYAFNDAGGAVLSRGGEAYTFPGAETIISVYGDMAVYRTSGNDWKLRVVTLGGKNVIPGEINPGEVTFAETGGPLGTLLVVNLAVPKTFAVYDTAGNEIMGGQGSAEYDRDSGLFSIDAEAFFGYMDTAGKFVFRVSLMDDMPD